MTRSFLISSVGLAITLGSLTACSDAADLGYNRGPVHPGIGGGSSSATGGAPGAAGAGGTAGTGGFAYTGGAVGMGGTMNTGGTVHTGGFGGGPLPNEVAVPISWNADGVIAPNPLEVGGVWFTVNDCPSAEPLGLACTVMDPTYGTESRPGLELTPQRACAHGMVARIEGDHGADQWGMDLGLTLRAPGPVDEAGEPYDALDHRVTGLLFDIEGNAPGPLWIHVMSEGNESSTHFIEADASANLAVRWNDPALQQGPWWPDKQPLDASKLTGLRIQIRTIAESDRRFDFCVSNVRLLTQ